VTPSDRSVSEATGHRSSVASKIKLLRHSRNASPVADFILDLKWPFWRQPDLGIHRFCRAYPLLTLTWTWTSDLAAHSACPITSSAAYYRHGCCNAEDATTRVYAFIVTASVAEEAAPDAGVKVTFTLS
jgi:hypothetical protein